MEAILVPELRTCKRICVANKQTHNCVHFSGIDMHQPLFFLKRPRYSHAIISFVQERCAGLNCLPFDVGFDCRMEAGRLAVLKSGYYGVF